MQHVRCDRKRSAWLSPLLALGLVVALGSSITAGPYCVWAQEMGPLANPVGSGFTYQGRLIKNDTPVDGVTCTFAFDLYSVASGGTPLDTDSVSAAVSDGYFSVALDFGSDAFTGEARWLQVSIQCPGDGSPAALDDQRIALAAAPYTHSLRPGSMVDGSAAGPYPGQGTFNVQNDDLSAGSAAVYAISGSGLGGYPSKAVGIRGEAADGFGVAGRSATSVGVYGSSISRYGVWGNSADDTGVMGTSSGGYGVYARGGSGDLSLYNGTLDSTLLPESDLTLRTNDYVDVHLDNDGGSASQFRILNDSDTVVFSVDESGVITGSVSGGNAWSLSGNAGTNPGANFLGTTDNVSLTLVVNNAAALRLVPGSVSPNIVGGYSGNSVTPNVAGGVIGGGGSSLGPNRIEGDHGTIGGGVGNVVTADYGTIGGGDSISVTGSTATVGGGGHNTASGYGAVVGGGGGFDLDVGLVGNRAAGNWSVIGGGSWNEATATHATVSGGFANVAGGLKATIGGGESISVTGEAATVAGGSLITATGDYAAVGGGIGHVVSDSLGTVGGGAYNIASGLAATVPGGSAAEAELYGQMAHASGAFSAIGDAQESFYVLRGETTPGSPTSELFLDGSAERLIVDNRTMTFDILVVARTISPWSAGYAAQGVIEGWGAGAVGLLGSPVITQLGDQIGGTSFAVSAEYGSLVLTATGPADTTVRWVATVRTAEVAW